MKGRLLLTGIVGFSLGILWYSFFSVGWFGASFIGLLGGVFLLFWFWKKETLYIACSVFLLGAMLGAARTELAERTLSPVFQPLIGTEITIEGIVVADPDIRENAQRLTVEIREERETTRILVVAPTFPAISYGETIRASGKLVPPEPFETNGGREFSYDAYLAKDGIFSIIQNAHIEQVAPRAGVFTHIRGALSDFKFAGLSALTKGLPEPHASLAGGLILGGKQGLGKELLNDFITVGLVHIVVLSGYNVMIVAQFILILFGLLSKKWAPLAAGLTIAAFVLAAGAGPASIRAGIMAGIGLYARATDRTYEAFRALIFTGILMLVWNPLTLAFDPGFQLSFIATLGLIFGVPLIEPKLSLVPWRWLREVIATTIAAQIAVLPLLLYENGLLSLVALPANILVLPLVPLAMLLSAIAGVAGFVLPSFAPVLAFPASLLLSYFTSVVESAASVPLAALSIPDFPFILVVIAYALLGYFLFRSHTSYRISKNIKR